MDDKKVETVLAWPALINVKGIRGFLGFANGPADTNFFWVPSIVRGVHTFYRQFILGYSDIAAPIYKLLQKDIPFDWGGDQQIAFDRLKAAFTTAPVLAHFKGSAETIVKTDTSDYAVGAVLLQRSTDGKLWPISHVSRTMVAEELNYDTFDKEVHRIIYALGEWHSYLLSLDQPFQIIIIHRALQYFMTTKRLTRRQVRWAELLSSYQFTIENCPGISNNVTDALSRQDDVYPKQRGINTFSVNNPNNI
ncbi:hypothetical protein P7C70_g9220, partial [Phenoliferia sp. Uapishka_3]